VAKSDLKGRLCLRREGEQDKYDKKTKTRKKTCGSDEIFDSKIYETAHVKHISILVTI